MSNGRFLFYYWNIQTLLNESECVESVTHMSSPDQADYAGTFEVRVTLRDGLQFMGKAALASNSEIIEFNYYYCVLTADGVRLKSYDDANHHPELPTHPHHMHRGAELLGATDPAYPSDLNKVCFEEVLVQVTEQYCQ